MNGAASAAATHHGSAAQQCAGAAGVRLHQVGGDGVVAAGIGGKQVQQCAASAVVQGGCGGQDGCSRHAAGAANDQYIAKAAFVAVVVALYVRGCGIEPGGGWVLLEGVAACQIVPPYLSAGVTTMVGE